MTPTPVTQAEVWDFLNFAFRHIKLPVLDAGDIDDVRAGLEAFARHRSSSTASSVDVDAPKLADYRSEITHPNNRLLFKRMAEAAGVDLGLDDIPTALRKVASLANTPAASRVGADVEAVARALFVFQHQGDIADPGRTWDAPDKGEHPIYWQQKMEHNHPHYRAMAAAALAASSHPASAMDTLSRRSHGEHP